MSDCQHCGNEITEAYRKRHPHAVTCSRNCSLKRAHHLYGRPRTSPVRATATTGAISELAVAVDLMLRGYDVFRALSPSCSCDLAILRNGKLIRVEVRTGARKADGTVIFSRMKRDHGRQDLYAVRTHDGVITYFPELSTFEKE